MGINSNPIRQIEESIELLRGQGLQAWTEYLLGVVPFLLALLWFVRDMTLGYYSARCAIESLICTLAFFWCSAWKARFAGRLAASISEQTDSEPGDFWRCLNLQAFPQTVRLFALPLAVVSLFPLPWTSSFFRNATTEASQKAATLRSVFSRSSRLASSGTVKYSLGLLIMLGFGGVVLVNVLSVVALLPVLLKSFTGYENEWTRHASGFLSWNVLGIAFALTWFLLDPLMQAYAVVRNFYSQARSDGRDLVVALRRLSVVLLVALMLGGVQRPVTAAAVQSVSQQDFEGAVNKSREADEYGWHRARKDSQNKLDNSFLIRMANGLNSALDTVKSWFSALGRWIRQLLKSAAETDGSKAPILGSGVQIKWLLYVLLALVFVGVVLVLIRNVMPRAHAPVEAAPTEATRDLAGDNILATDLPEEEWLRLAREYLSKGELRLALRAMYLSNLAFLGALQLIRIARAKTNAVYERELRPRARTAELYTAFAQANRNFEKVWYGFYEVTPDLVEVFKKNVEVIRSHARA